jgi:hypothetical protein
LLARLYSLLPAAAWIYRSFYGRRESQGCAGLFFTIRCCGFACCAASDLSILLAHEIGRGSLSVAKVAPPAEQRFRMSAVSWEGYLHLGQAFAGKHVRMTYDRGELELRTVSLDHDRDKSVFAADAFVLACSFLTIELFGKLFSIRHQFTTFSSFRLKSTFPCSPNRAHFLLGKGCERFGSRMP